MKQYLYKQGEQVILKATPSDGWAFEYWLDNGEKIPGITSNELSIIMDDDREISARFRRLPERDVVDIAATITPMDFGEVLINGEVRENNTYSLKVGDHYEVKVKPLPIVKALPSILYKFVTWSDNNTNPIRSGEASKDGETFKGRMRVNPIVNVEFFHGDLKRDFRDHAHAVSTYFNIERSKDNSTFANTEISYAKGDLWRLQNHEESIKNQGYGNVADYVEVGNIYQKDMMEWNNKSEKDAQNEMWNNSTHAQYYAIIVEVEEEYNNISKNQEHQIDVYFGDNGYNLKDILAYHYFLQFDTGAKDAGEDWFIRYQLLFKQGTIKNPQFLEQFKTVTEFHDTIDGPLSNDPGACREFKDRRREVIQGCRKIFEEKKPSITEQRNILKRALGWSIK